jgi:hypothetical protein
MSKPQPKRRAPNLAPGDRATSASPDDGLPSAGDESSFAWSSTRRVVASILILGYLAIVIIGPLSNPVASEHLSAPLAEKVSPIHRALFLGHGYRFFAPDPGPSHLVVYRGVRSDGTRFEGHFPDREKHWPRLLYHRWFMLSETIFNEQIVKPTVAQFQQRNREYNLEIENLRKTNKLDRLKQLTIERDEVSRLYEQSRLRCEMLSAAIARVLLERNQGESIELFVQERQIPFPEQVVDGIRLDDEDLLSARVKIGELDSTGFRTIETEQLPSQEESQ